MSDRELYIRSGVTSAGLALVAAAALNVINADWPAQLAAAAVFITAIAWAAPRLVRWAQRDQGDPDE